MDVFGSHWRDHPQRIATAWQARVAPDDFVLIGGDVSWAMKLSDALIDLRWIDALPGRKVLIKGNHDYWWDRVGPLRPHLPASITAQEADAPDIGTAVIVMIHYPPFVNRQPTEFARRIAAAGAAACIYGHLHRPNDWAMAVQGHTDGVFYQLTACD